MIGPQQFSGSCLPTRVTRIYRVNEEGIRGTPSGNLHALRLSKLLNTMSFYPAKEPANGSPD
jgi:hypothetical protein